ncbi:MAG: bifunctional metallophosphatase/5'-nucleotidase [Planctomycetota bacterium]|nr:bifunctional metallophosphatase/5'-nucleotidase [Planctomycetota bacterium]MDA0932324.1 bifunctional metallophosphatase/5'-nucleotidase [Planctomycetota bacterium]MDA1220900.1 bifunctional metallophosphatase/5'-nucleotidase [Planctomycetota bacterium]
MPSHRFSLFLAAFGTLATLATGQTRVQLLHASDLEGGVEAITDAPNFAAVVEALEADAVSLGLSSVLLSSGDNYIPGPFFNAAADGSLRSVFRSVLGNPDAREGEGRVDISVMNILGFDAACVGNHEFDAGTSAFLSIVGTDIRNGFTQARWLGSQFPYLSANLDFSGDPNLSGLHTSSILPNTAFRGTLSDLAAAAAAPKFASATIVTRGTEQFGIVGATTPLVESISSTGGVTVRNPGAGTNDMAALASVIQPTIDAVRNLGVDKIILVTHLQRFSLEQALTPLLHGVDVVIAGGSDTLLADGTDYLRPGDVAAGVYPFATTNADNEPALIVSTDGQYSYVGRLVVDFDANGVVQPTTVSSAQSGVYATDTTGVLNVHPSLAAAFAPGTDAAAVQTLTGAVSGIVTARDGNIMGKASVFLEGRRTQVRTEEANLGSLTADANLAAARSFDPNVQVSHKNGGGIRNPIGSIDGLTGELGPNLPNPIAGKLAGEISQLDIENSLRFNNGLSLLTLTRSQLKDVLEHAVAATAAGNTPGQFGQFAGLSFSFDATLPAGNKVRFAALTDANSTEPVLVQDGNVVGAAPVRIVTLNFLADGGDSYPFPAFQAANPTFFDRVDLYTQSLPPGNATFATPGTEQDAMAEYLLANHVVTPYGVRDRAVGDDQRIQQIGTRPGLAVNGPAGNESLDVTGADPLAFLVLAAGTHAGDSALNLGFLGELSNGVGNAFYIPIGVATGSGSGSLPLPATRNLGVDVVVQMHAFKFIPSTFELDSKTTESVAVSL